MDRVEILSYYSKKFQRLRVDRSHGVAPHKPILLLSIIELIEKDVIFENKILLSPFLIATFLKYWSYLATSKHNPDISRPFFHMRSGKFWHLYANPGFERIISDKLKLKTYHSVKQAISHAYLDEDLFEFLVDEKSRSSLQAIIASRWFPNHRHQISKISMSQSLRDDEGYLQQKYISFYHCGNLSSTLRNLERNSACSKI